MKFRILKYLVIFCYFFPQIALGTPKGIHTVEDFAKICNPEISLSSQDGNDQFYTCLGFTAGIHQLSASQCAFLKIKKKSPKETGLEMFIFNDDGVSIKDSWDIMYGWAWSNKQSWSLPSGFLVGSLSSKFQCK